MSITLVNFGYKPREWQRRIHKEKKRFSIAICHRRAGKSHAARMELLHCALEMPKGHFGYIAPFLTQARKVMWLPLRDLARQVPGTEIRESDMSVEFPNGAIIRCMGADNADSIRGLGFHGLVCDEFQLWDQTVLPLVVMPTLAGINGWLMLIGTPTGVDALTEKYDKVSVDPQWQAWKFTVADTGVLSREEIEIQRKGMTPQQFNMEMMCSFDAGSPNQLFPGDLITLAFGKNYDLDLYRSHPRIMGVDVARQGDDRSVIYRRQGPMSWEPVVFQEANLMETARRVATEYFAFKADTLFMDGGGVGAGAVDGLREMGVPVVEAQFGGKPMDIRYANARAEMYHSLYHWLDGGGRLYPSVDLKAELKSLRYATDDHGRLKLESKEDLRKRGMRSPDIADALALTFYAPVSMNFGPVDQVQAPKSDWDPIWG